MNEYIKIYHNDEYGSNIFDFFKGPRKNYPPSFLKVKNEIGDIQIKDMKICRKPINKNITYLFNILTLGKLENIKSCANCFDKKYNPLVAVSLDHGEAIFTYISYSIALKCSPVKLFPTG